MSEHGKAAPAGDGLPASLQESLLAGSTAVNAPLTEAAAGRLLDYLRLLEKWNASFNLSGITGPGEMLDRHLLDSLSVAPWIRGDSGEVVVDAGSGAGLPGIPLAVLFPEKRFVLVDSNGKKTRFLFQAKLDLALANVKVAHCRIEQYCGPADLIVCRALGKLAEIVTKTQHLMSRGAMLVAMRGRHPGAELAHLPGSYEAAFVEQVQVPGASSRHIVGVRRRVGKAGRG